MREFLFRGKREYGKEKEKGWVFGGIVCADKDTLWSQKDKVFITEIPKYLSSLNLVEVAPETVGQYTGLTDKNGKKIFEGDIVDCWSEGVNAQGTVQQRKDGLWIIYPAWQKYIMWGLCPDEYSNTTVEVIGNIYDNPELINKM